VGNLKRETVFTYVIDDGRVPIQKLPIKDQIRVLIKKLLYDESSELKREDIVTKEELRMRTNLILFLNKATDPIRKKGKKSVTIRLSSKFSPALESVMANSKFLNYYTFEVSKPNVEYDVDYFFQLTMKVKE